MTKRLLWPLKAAISLGLICYIFSLVPFAEVVSMVAAAKLHYVALALLMGITTRYVVALRMRLLTDRQGIPLSTWDIQKINLATSFYGLLLPGYLVGGAIRWYKLSSADKNFSGALMAMVVNRLMQTIVFAALGLAFWMLDEGARAHGFIGITIAAFLGLLLVIQLVISNRVAAAYLTRPIVQVSFIPQSIRAILQRLAECADRNAGLARSLPSRLWGLTVMGEVFGLVSFCLFAASLQIDLSIISLGWVRSVVLMATMLPLSILGLGVRDATLIYLLDPYGVAAASAVALSFLLFARQMLAGLLGGLIEIKQWLARPRELEPPAAPSTPAFCLWGTSLKKVADEAQLLAISRTIRRYYPSAALTIFVRNGELIKEYLPDVTTIKTASLLHVIRAMARARVFIIVGGPFLEAWRQMLGCFVLVSLAKLLRIPVMSYGTTVIEYKTAWGRVFFQYLLERINVITVREEFASRELKNIGVRKPIGIYADPRFSLEPVSPPEVHAILRREGIIEGMPMIGLTTRYLHVGMPQWVKRSHGFSDDMVSCAYEAIGHALQDLAGVAQLILIPMHPSHEDDLRTAEMIGKFIRPPTQLKVLTRSYRSPELMGIIGACDMVVASRLGSAIFATATATPMVAIAYEARMFDHMKRIDYPQYVIDWRELRHESFSRMVREVWNSRTEIRANLRSRVPPMKDSAYQNAELIAQLL